MTTTTTACAAATSATAKRAMGWRAAQRRAANDPKGRVAETAASAPVWFASGSHSVLGVGRNRRAINGAAAANATHENTNGPTYFGKPIEAPKVLPGASRCGPITLRRVVARH